MRQVKPTKVELILRSGVGGEDTAVPLRRWERGHPMSSAVGREGVTVNQRRRHEACNRVGLPIREVWGGGGRSIRTLKEVSHHRRQQVAGADCDRDTRVARPVTACDPAGRGRHAASAESESGPPACNRSHRCRVSRIQAPPGRPRRPSVATRTLRAQLGAPAPDDAYRPGQ